jgi:hypothetical protein
VDTELVDMARGEIEEMHVDIVEIRFIDRKLCNI